MVDDEEAETAITMLQMMIAGLAEDIADAAAARTPGDLSARLMALAKMKRDGELIALFAESATEALHLAFRSTN